MAPGCSSSYPRRSRQAVEVLSDHVNGAFIELEAWRMPLSADARGVLSRDRPACLAQRRVLNPSTHSAPTQSFTCVIIRTFDFDLGPHKLATHDTNLTSESFAAASSSHGPNTKGPKCAPALMNTDKMHQHHPARPPCLAAPPPCHARADPLANQIMLRRNPLAALAVLRRRLANSLLASESSCGPPQVSAAGLVR